MTGLPDNKYLCGYDACTRGLQYCYDPSGRQDKDFMICKACSYTLEDCKSGQFVSNCSRYCFDLYKKSLDTLGHKLLIKDLLPSITVIVLLLFILGFILFILCRCLKPKRQYEKFCTNYFFCLTFGKKRTDDGELVEVKLLEHHDENEKEKINENNNHVDEEMATLPKSISREDVENLGKHTDVTDAQGEDIPVNIDPQSPDSSRSSPSPEGHLEQDEHEVIRLSKEHKRFNNITNATPDIPEPCFK